MGTLKSFLITEELKVSHAERYLTFVDRYHNEVFHDLKKQLSKDWERTLKSLSRHYQVHPEAKQEAILRNPKATTEVALSNAPIKLVTSRSSTPLEVSPSIKIPLVYTEEVRALITKELLEVAQQSMESLVHQWSEIFNFEKKGRITPWFKISSDHEEVRFQLAITTGNLETYRTLYAIRIEYGKRGSKLKDFDRVYLVSLIK